MKFTESQKKFIKENYADEIDEVINAKIDSDLTYHEDIENAVHRFANIVACLRGEYTMEDLYEDLFNDYYYDNFDNFDEIAEEVYEEYLDEEQQKEVDEV